MSNIATTIVQSKRLLELGLSPDSADMWWSNRFVYWNSTPMICVATEQNQLYTFKWCEMDIPAWSLPRLLEMMPKMEADSTVCLGCVSTLIRCKSHDFMWQHDSTAAQPIDAAYEMVCYLLEQGMINKGGEQ